VVELFLSLISLLPADVKLSQIKFTVFCDMTPVDFVFEKGSAADATDAPQP
jgi:hypothetical protein